ncbi:MAG: CDP-diacylglycerol--serine O-phosphatidyltransferase [Algoriphagus sp.]|jgi:CDP-diacylglycerol--serine O-phosphatidyltransferase
MKLFTVPNFITLGNLVCGFFGILAANQGRLQDAGIFIFIALILDFLDGFVARIFNSYSEIGKQLDSLADMVSFGVLPSFILYYLMENDGYLRYISIIPALSSALRLAKFNIDERQSNSFRGLPTPANAMVVASFPFILTEEYNFLKDDLITLFFCVYTVLISIIMISNLPMLALKFKNYSWTSNSLKYLFLIISVALVAILKFAAIPLILILYIGFSFNRKKTN